MYIHSGLGIKSCTNIFFHSLLMVDIHREFTDEDLITTSSQMTPSLFLHHLPSQCVIDFYCTMLAELWQWV
jgi:hypothetical protein